ncbi:MAG TPA: polysaccharide deacetylase family protein [Bacteroidales bacterium]|nr:polysaccharide deacetylase family protein [Bacteroidales bacterium]
MLTYRRFTLLFFLVLAAINLLAWLPGLFLEKTGPGLVIVLNLFVILAWLSVSVAMSFLPCSGFYLPVICRGTAGAREVAVTFDDGPSAGFTPGVLEVLARHGAKAAFFCTGQNLQKNRLLGERIAGEGHIIGNHSWSHSFRFDLFSFHRIQIELERTDEQVMAITGKRPLLFRPPFGVINPTLAKALSRDPRHTVCWNIRSFDTLRRDPGKVTGRILRKLKPGSVILLHDHTPYVQNHLDRLLDGIRDAGFAIVPLDKLIDVNAYA